jgi:hypothetical protein
VSVEAISWALNLAQVPGGPRRAAVWRVQVRARRPGQPRRARQLTCAHSHGGLPGRERGSAEHGRARVKPGWGVRGRTRHARRPAVRRSRLAAPRRSWCIPWKAWQR